MLRHGSTIVNKLNAKGLKYQDFPYLWVNEVGLRLGLGITELKLLHRITERTSVRRNCCYIVIL